MKPGINKIEDELRRWDKSHTRPLFDDRQYLEGRLEFMEALFKKISGNTEKESEKASLEILKKEIEVQNKRLQPNMLWEFLKKLFGSFGAKSQPIDTKQELKFTFSDDNFAKPKDGDDKKSHTYYFSDPYANVPRRGPYLKEDPRKEALVSQVERDLFSRGLYTQLQREQVAAIYLDEKSFSVPVEKLVEGKKLKVDINYQKSNVTGRYYATEMKASLRQVPEITESKINGVGIAYLKRHMEEMTHLTGFEKDNLANPSNPILKGALSTAWPDIEKRLGQLKDGPEAGGVEVYNKLVYSVFAHTNAESLIPNMAEIKAKYEINARMSLNAIDKPSFYPPQLNNLMSGRSVKGEGNTGWYSMNGQPNGENGKVYEIKKIEGSEKYSLPTVLFRANVWGFTSDTESAIKKLENGDNVTATLQRGQTSHTKLIFASPKSNEVKIDWEASALKGFHDIKSAQKIEKASRVRPERDKADSKSNSKNPVDQDKAESRKTTPDGEEKKKERKYVYVEYPNNSSVPRGRRP